MYIYLFRKIILCNFLFIFIYGITVLINSYTYIQHFVSLNVFISRTFIKYRIIKYVLPIALIPYLKY